MPGRHTLPSDVPSVSGVPGGAVLLTGASGFVGSHLRARLRAEGVPVRCASRDPSRAAAAHPGCEWVGLDVGDRSAVARALAGCRAVVYLVHAMGGGPGYEERELAAAQVMAEEAARAGLERIVYLGGVAPAGRPSRHLRSRLRTGEVLRAGPVPVFELRAAMIVGHGSTSFRIVRDLAARLPAMILPRWLATRSRPVALEDVVFAISLALRLSLDRAGVFDLPGPEVLSAEEVLLRLARLRGTRPLTVKVPVLTPRLSSYWLKLVTRADFDVARELVEGLTSDLLPSGPSLWALAPDHRLLSFDEAAALALAQDERRLDARTVWAERQIGRAFRR
jgi:uncharacterized protein YbjT (DUF2867 family)